MTIPPGTIQLASGHLDLSARRQATNVVAASPSGSSETTICTYTITNNIPVVKAVTIWAQAAFTVGTSGVSARLRLRNGTITGTVVGDTGALTVTAASLYNFCLLGYDTAASLPNQTYVLTLTVGSGGATSTVGFVGMDFTIV